MSAILLATLLVAACDPTGPGNGGSLLITPSHVAVQPGDTTVMVFTTTDVLITPVRWRSLDTTLATVDSLGRVAAVAPGLDSIEVTTSTEDADLADTATVTIAAACPDAPFLAAVNLAGTSTPAHLESIAQPVDVVAGGMCAGPRTAQSVSLVFSASGTGDRTVATVPVPDTVPARWRAVFSFDPSAKDAGGTPLFPAGAYTMSAVWRYADGHTSAAALPVTVRTR